MSLINKILLFIGILVIDAQISNSFEHLQAKALRNMSLRFSLCCQDVGSTSQEGIYLAQVELLT